MLFVDPPAAGALAMAVNDNSAAYDLVLLTHVLTALVGLVAVVAAGGFALSLRRALRRGGRLPDAFDRYYRPGVNRVGRVLFAVPVLGVALMAMSRGQWGWSDSWISSGMAAWAAVALAAETVLWPGERQLQLMVAGCGPDRGPDGGPDSVPDGGTKLTGEAAGVCLRVGLTAAGCALALVAIAALMVVKP